MYNLIAYYSTTKKVYFALSAEAMADRAGNDDSCVPQNRNSIVSNGILALTQLL